MEVLVVEDDEFIRDIIKKSLLSAGYKVSESGNGKDALEKLKQNRFDLLITDSVMPHGGMMPMFDYVTEQHRTMPVLIITGGLDPELYQNLEQAEFPMENILEKPFSKEKLLSAVKSLLPSSG